LYCFAYDAESKTYLFQAEKVVGGFIFGSVLLFFIYLVRTGRKKDDNDITKT
jgi:protein SCO1/2